MENEADTPTNVHLSHAEIRAWAVATVLERYPALNDTELTLNFCWGVENVNDITMRVSTPDYVEPVEPTPDPVGWWDKLVCWVRDFR